MSKSSDVKKHSFTGYSIAYRFYVNLSIFDCGDLQLGLRSDITKDV